MGQEVVKIYECTKCGYGTTTTQSLNKCKMCGSELKLLKQFPIDSNKSLKATTYARIFTAINAEYPSLSNMWIN